MLNKKSLLYYLTYQFVPKPFTLQKGSKNTVHQKYDFSYINDVKILKGTEKEICEELYSKLKKTIKKYLPPRGKPLGVLLSGGLDSAAMLHILREITDRKIFTITAAFDKKSKKLIFASKLAKRYNAFHKNLIIHPDKIKILNEIYRKKTPQPIGDNGLPLTYLMLKKLKKNVDVIFSGDGADCLFSGLKMHYLNFSEKSRKSTKSNSYQHYRFGEIFLTEKDIEQFFGKYPSHIALTEPLKNIADRIKTKDILKRQLLIDLNFLVKNRVDYLICSSKTCEVNLILPYLDKEFVNFAVNIPGKYLIKNHEQKYILKKSFENKLPRAVINRSKEGFKPPFELWYQQNKKFVIRKLVKSVKLGIPKDYIKHLISTIPRCYDYQSGMKIWLVLNLVCWHEGKES